MAKKKKIDISKVVLDINGKKIELTLDEAKELKQILGDLFVKENVVYPYIPYIRPYYYEPHIGTTWTTRTTTTGDTNALYCSTTNMDMNENSN